MAFFPAGFDPSADVVGVIDLVQIDTPDGVFGFMPGQDGKFVGLDGITYWGSSLISAGNMQSAIQGTAPSGELSLSWIQDPDAGDLIAEIKTLGLDYIDGRWITFLVMPLQDMNEFYAPPIAPIQFARRRMTRVTYEFSGPLTRSITLGFEGPFADRNSAPNLYYTAATPKSENSRGL
jgi:hypothetical protein